MWFYRQTFRKLSNLKIEYRYCENEENRQLVVEGALTQHGFLFYSSLRRLLPYSHSDFLRVVPSRSLENLLLRNGLAEEKRRFFRDAPFCMRSGCLYLRLPREAPRVSLDFLPEDVQTGPYWFDGSIYRLSRSAHELALENLLGDASDYSRVAATRVNRRCCITRVPSRERCTERICKPMLSRRNYCRERDRSTIDIIRATSSCINTLYSRKLL